MKKYLYFLLLAFAAFGCMEMDQREVYLDHPLLGNWEVLGYTEEGMELKKVPGLGPHTAGFNFKANGELIQRQNSSWCGTPPLVLADYPGTWSKEGQGISINGKYWGGNYTAQWELLRISDGEALVRIKEIDYQ